MAMVIVMDQVEQQAVQQVDQCVRRGARGKGPTVHSAECIAEHKAIDDSRAAWLAQWPDYCRKCDGYGRHSYTEMHGFGYGSGEELSDPCPECVERMKCPRCGQAGLQEDAEPDGAGIGPCSCCGWNDDAGLPPTSGEVLQPCACVVAEGELSW